MAAKDDAYAPSTGVGKEHADAEEAVAEEMTEEERLAIKRRCLRVFDVLLLLFGGALCGGALYTSTFMYASIGEALMYALAGVGGAIFAVNLLGLFSVCSNNVRISALVTYFTFLIFLAFAMLVVGGFCFILTRTAVAYVNDNWNTIIQSIPPERRAALSQAATANNVRTVLYSTGGGALVIFMLSVGAMSQAVALLTPSRAYTVFLQATNIALLPIGIALIAAATYVADTAVTAEAAVAAFSIFILGVFVVVLLLVGCVGTSLQSRGIVRLFMLLTLLLGLAFLAFGVLSLVQSSLVAGFITSQWDVLRRVLPPDFSGKYDKEQFQKFIDANLTALGFLAVCAGVVLVAQFWASYRLRSELKFESQVEQQAWDAANKGELPKEVAESISGMHARSRAQIVWKQQWTKGTKTSRRLIICGCVTLCSLVVIIIGLAVAALYYSTSCTKLGKYSETQLYSSASLAPAVFVANNYSLGTTHITVDTAATTRTLAISFKKAAFQPDMAASGWPQLTTRNVTLAATDVDVLGGGAGSTVTYTGLVATEKDLTQILGYDVSCQNSDINVAVPRAAVYHGGLGNSRAASDAFPLVLDLASVRASNGIDIDWSAVATANKPRIRFAKLLTTSGPIGLTGALIGSKGFTANAGSGEVSVQDVEATCDPNDIGGNTGGLRVTTERGAVNVLRLNSTDCDVTITVAQSLARVTGSHITNTLGGGTLKVLGAKGVMEIAQTTADVFDLKGEEGSIRVSNITIRESIKVATQSGIVSLQQLRLATRGVVQVETDSGSIDIWASAFRGIISVVTGGSITCFGGTATGFDDANPCSVTAGGQIDSSGAQTLRVVEQVSVNCKTPARNDCPYMGHITITSTRGNVVLRMDKL